MTDTKVGRRGSVVPIGAAVVGTRRRATRSRYRRNLLHLQGSAAPTAHPGSAEAQQPVAEREADAALEWMAGGHPLDLLTQQRLQWFLWYKLPLNWTIDGNDKGAVADALARTFDVLGRPHYAEICRSHTTVDVLAAYERNTADGLVAFDEADAASGIRPPDVADFTWGATVGGGEAQAYVATAQFLEAAVVSGLLVPGTPGWKGRQQRLVGAHLNIPRLDLGGKTPIRVIDGERVDRWLYSHGRTGRKLLSTSADLLRRPVMLPAGTADPLPPLRWLLEHLIDGVATTRSGNLNRRFVIDAAEQFGWDLPGQPRTEDDLNDLHQLRRLAQHAGLVRRSEQALVLTAKGRAGLEDPEVMWRAVARRLIPAQPFGAVATKLLLAQLAGPASPSYQGIVTTIRQAVTEEGFHDIRTGSPPDKRMVSWAIHDTLSWCGALGLLATGGDWPGTRYQVTSTGRATALEALRAHATRPSATPAGSTVPMPR